MRPLVPLFGKLTVKEIDELVTVSINNPQVWSAAKCKEEYLPRLIKLRGKEINTKKKGSAGVSDSER